LISKEGIEDVLKRLGLEPQIRGEALEPDGFVAIARGIHRLTNKVIASNEDTELSH
jgi:hypothetical protein